MVKNYCHRVIIADYIWLMLETNDIKIIADALNRGEVGAIPTETVYGLAANAFDEKAVSRIFEIKNRPQFDPLICHVGSMDQIVEFVLDFPDVLKKLAEAYWPGPLTLLLPKKDNLPDLVTSGSSLVAIRIPEHPLALSLLKELDFPVAAPSANPFGYISPTSAKHVKDQLNNKVDFILDGGECRVGIESTIVGLEGGEVFIYRQGGISQEQISQVTGPLKSKLSLEHPELAQNAKSSPGLLKSHYAPKKKLVLGRIEELIKAGPFENPGVLTYRRLIKGVPRERQMMLSIQGDLNEAAQRLFKCLRKLDDREDIDVIYAEKVPHFGLGLGINDRLQRAASK